LFGYVLPERQELKVKEFELFKAYYCGVCKSIAKKYGQIPRLTLNYDTTFLALILESIAGETVSIKSERCIAHPVKKRNVIRNSEIVDYASDMNVLLAYYKLLDNWQDEKSILSGTGMLALKKSYKKIKRKYNEKCDIIRKRLGELTILEKEKCSSIDRAAEPFAKLMEEVLSYDPLKQNDNNMKILKWIGYNLGKWIYISDAYDDISKDIKEKSYNPFLCQYNYTGENVDDFKLSIKDKVEFNLTHSLSQIAKAYELLSPGSKTESICSNSCNDSFCTPDVKGIVENIIYLGLLRKTEQILAGASKIPKAEDYSRRSREEIEKSV
jgi:hypothetical protein